MAVESSRALCRTGVSSDVTSFPLLDGRREDSAGCGRGRRYRERSVGMGAPGTPVSRRRSQRLQGCGRSARRLGVPQLWKALEPLAHRPGLGARKVWLFWFSPLGRFVGCNGASFWTSAPVWAFGRFEFACVILRALSEGLGLVGGFRSWKVRRLDLGRRIGSGSCCMREVSTSTHVYKEGLLLCVVSSSSSFLSHTTSCYLTWIIRYSVLRI